MRNLTEAKGNLRKSAYLFGLGVLAALLTFSANVACKKAAQEGEETAQAEAASAVKNEYEGTVKCALGKYLYLPSAQGFDIVIQGNLDSGTSADLAGKDIKVKGNLLRDKPSLFVADAVELKDGEVWKPVFTRTQEVTFEDYLDTKDRDAFTVLSITGVNKPEEWEGKGKGKILGKLEKTADGAPLIVLTDEKGKEVGKIIVDSTTDYAQYYIQKLRLYDKFWFYLNIKDTVDKKVRTKSRELFHADVLFTGLY